MCAKSHRGGTTDLGELVEVADELDALGKDGGVDCDGKTIQDSSICSPLCRSDRFILGRNIDVGLRIKQGMSTQQSKKESKA